MSEKEGARGIKLHFDFHFHSCLSPCGDEAMTPATIAGMCKLSGLDAAALTDHNTCGNCAAFCQAAEAYGLLALPGMELCTREEVHIVCVFPDLERAGAFQEEVYRSLGEARNDPAIFGRQLYLDADDRVLGEEPRLDVPVTVYSFSDFSLPEDAPDAATQAVTFTLDPERTTVLSYGFNGMSQEAGWRQYSYFVPNGVRSESDLKLLVIIGDDLGAYTLQGYVDGGCEQMLADVSCTVTRTETTFDAVLEEICRSYAAEYNARRSTEEATAFDFLSLDMLQRAAAELLTQYGLFSENAKDRYSDGRLDEIVSESLVQERVLYLVFPVTIPAGGSAAVSVALWKEPSYDFGCSGSENTDLQGYDLITCLGSTLNFTSQTAVLAETQGVELVRQNIGFDPEDGITQVPLDLTEEHYFIEIRPTP